jgi:hypothetical protein
MQALLITLLGLLGAVLYGIVHDQITVRICLEYFTVFHPPLVATEDPTLLGLAWGVAATWWVGLPLGLLLAWAARAGGAPKLDARRLVLPVLVLLGVMAASAAVAGVVGFLLGRSGLVVVAPRLATSIPAAKHAAFLADLWAHNASYGVGAVGGLVLVVGTWRRRRRSASTHVDPPGDSTT